MMKYLVARYPQDIAYANIANALKITRVGRGTGMNTGAARHVMGPSDTILPFENYYAKAIIELGIAGGILIVVLFGTLLIEGFKQVKHSRDPLVHSTASAIWTLLTLCVIYSFKGPIIDLDPMNVYFWLFTGMLFRIPSLP